MKKSLVIFGFVFLFVSIMMGNFVMAEENVTCVDSDGGKDYFVKGYVNATNMERIFEDECSYNKGIDRYYLYELYCAEGIYVNTDLIICDYGCEDGACIEANETVQSNEVEEIPEEEIEESACIPEYFCVVDPPSCPEIELQTETCVDVVCGTEGAEREINCEPEVCVGCRSNGVCIPYGFRLQESSQDFYCDMNGELKQQRTKDNEGNWAECQNNFECKSNICTNQECVDVNSLIEEGNKFKTRFVSILCKMLHPISQDKYNSCVYNFLA